jgi:hypothetical protein
VPSEHTANKLRPSRFGERLYRFHQPITKYSRCVGTVSGSFTVHVQPPASHATEDGPAYWRPDSS